MYLANQKLFGLHKTASVRKGLGPKSGRGDAAHVMSPFGGDGANLAMLDGAELAEALLQPEWPIAVVAFEEKMWQRGLRILRGIEPGNSGCLLA